MERRFTSYFLTLISLVHFAIGSQNLTHPRGLCSQCECLGLGSASDPFSVNCNNLDLKTVPEIWKDLKTQWRFQLNGNSITEIPVFMKLDNLTALSMKYNKIFIIAEAAFLNLTNIESIDLSYNNITSDTLRPGTFKGPYHDKLPNPLPLKSLDLSNNHIDRLPKGIFHPLLNLTELYLSHNPFIDFSTKTAEAFSELTSLQTLDLSYTKLQRLPSHFFAELTKLKYLDLSGNNFISVPEEVNYARSIRSLILNDNIFAWITADSFWESLDKLETLKLSKSETLFRVENGAFGNLTSLKYLWISENPQLSFISPGAFTSKDNHTLHLMQLNLEKNQLETLSADALPWKEISNLNLQENPWNCDCKFEYFVKEVVAPMERTNYDLTRHVICATPQELMGSVVTETKVQTHEFVCRTIYPGMAGAGMLIIATIVVGTLLLVTGTIIFSYVLFRRTKVSDWIGDHVKYRRTQNEDEEVITSTEQY